MISLDTKGITKDNFKNFGKIVTIPSGNPTSEGATYKFWADIAHYYIDGETEIGICTVYKQQENIITGLERHLYTPEILIPIDAAFALPVQKAGTPTESIRSFRVNIGQAVVIDNAVWHGACLPVSVSASSYFVIFKRDTPANDVEMKEIQPINIRI